MKMQNNIEAETSGTITSINVNSKFQRISFCLSTEFSPIRIAILVYGTNLKCIGGAP